MGDERGIAEVSQAFFEYRADFNEPIFAYWFEDVMAKLSTPYIRLWHPGKYLGKHNLESRTEEGWKTPVDFWYPFAVGGNTGGHRGRDHERI